VPSGVGRTVIDHRFGLESGENEKPMTLEQVGQIIGVTNKEAAAVAVAAAGAPEIVVPGAGPNIIESVCAATWIVPRRQA